MLESGTTMPEAIDGPHRPGTALKVWEVIDAILDGAKEKFIKKPNGEILLLGGDTMPDGTQVLGGFIDKGEESRTCYIFHEGNDPRRTRIVLGDSGHKQLYSLSERKALKLLGEMIALLPSE